MSLERTGALADECLSTYLRTRLKPSGHLGNSNDLQFRNKNINDTGGCPGIEGRKLMVPATVLPSPGGLKPKSRSNSMEHASQNVERNPGHSMPLLNTVADNQENVGNPSPAPFATHMAPPTRAPPSPPQQDSVHLVRHDLLDQDKVGLHVIGIAHPKSIFHSLEEYIVDCFKNCDNLNASFAITRPMPLPRAFSEGAAVKTNSRTNTPDQNQSDSPIAELDAKTLLVGDFAENGMWWTGRGRIHSLQAPKSGHNTFEDVDPVSDRVRGKVPRMRWLDIHQWYETILHAGSFWESKFHSFQINIAGHQYDPKYLSAEDRHQISSEITEARLHLQKTLLRASENLLRRPGRFLKQPEDCRFLLILLANPFLYTADLSQRDWISPNNFTRSTSQTRTTSSGISAGSPQRGSAFRGTQGHPRGPASGRHSGVLKRILGLLANIPKDCHHYVIAWFTQLPEKELQRLVEMVGGFVTYRLTRHQGLQHGDIHHQRTSDLMPQIPGRWPGSSAQLHAALSMAGMSPTPGYEDTMEYSEDWQIRAAARVMLLLFTANDNASAVGQNTAKNNLSFMSSSIVFPTTSQRAHGRGQFLPISTFYNSMLDYFNLIADFEAWESRRGKFFFCQYPMFLSIHAKIRILEYDARRQMENKAREAFFDSINSRKAVNQYLSLKVRRNCLVEDSLRGVSEIVGTGQQDIKKGLRIEFSGEEGVDAGG